MTAETAVSESGAFPDPVRDDTLGERAATLIERDIL